MRISFFTAIFCFVLGFTYGDILAGEESFRCAGFPRLRSNKNISAKVIGVSPIPSKGRLNALAIFAKFQGEAPEDMLAPEWAQDLFDSDLPGSFSHFYSEMSFGQLKIDGTFLTKRYSSDHGISYYIAESDTSRGRFGEFNLEILRKVDLDLNFGQYDNDGPDNVPNSGDDDGYVDFIFINLRTTPRGFLIGTATGIASLGFESDFVTDDKSNSSGFIRISGFRGATQRTDNFSYAVGSMAHEFGHALGLPDLYDTSFLTDTDQSPEDDSAGIGRWGLMGHGALGWNGNDGPNSFSAWSREQLGWIGRDNENLVTVREDLKDVVISDVETGGKVYKVPVRKGQSVPIGDHSASTGEYFLVENRQPSGDYYDRNIPKGGLLIWHIVSNAGSNNREERKMVDLECADGLFNDKGYPKGVLPNPISGRDNLDFWSHDDSYRESHNGNLGDATDIFDGLNYTSFTLNSNPSSDDQSGYYRGASTGISISNIRSNGSDMIADFSIPKWSGHISKKGTIWEGDVSVVGDVTVDADASLTILPGTTVRFAPTDIREEGADPSRCELNIYGILRIEDPVVFTSAAPDPQDGDWYGIRVAEGSALFQDFRRINKVLYFCEFFISIGFSKTNI